MKIVGYIVVVFFMLVGMIGCMCYAMKNLDMVDTIVLRIHNIKRYNLLHEQFKLSSVKKNSYIEGYSVVDEDGVITEKKKVFQKVAFFEDRDKFLPLVNRFDICAPSSAYNVRGYIRGVESDKAYLEVEFSLPKYFYATNVFQLLGMPSHSSEANFSMLVRAIKRFMSDSFNQVPKDYDVEIYRLDMCYNQFFNTMEDAVRYVNMQTDHMRNYCRGKNMRMGDSHPDQSWSILTARYSFKCYHKGAEFRKNDYPELVKNLDKHKYDLSKLQSIADRILRYEITFRSSMMHYLTMYYTFQDIEKKRGYMLDSNLYSYLKRVQKMGFTPEMGERIVKQKTGIVDYFVNRKKQFRLRSEFDLPFSSMVVFSDSVTYNYSVYRLMYDFFWSKVKVAQVEEGLAVDTIADKINGYNEKIRMTRNLGLSSRDKVKKGSLRDVAKKNTARIWAPALLSSFVDIRILKQYFPPATYKRLISDFKKIGLPLKNGRVIIMKPPLDYVDNGALLEPLKRNYII